MPAPRRPLRSRRYRAPHGSIVICPPLCGACYALPERKWHQEHPAIRDGAAGEVRWARLSDQQERNHGSFHKRRYHKERTGDRGIADRQCPGNVNAAHRSDLAPGRNLTACQLTPSEKERFGTLVECRSSSCRRSDKMQSAIAHPAHDHPCEVCGLIYVEVATDSQRERKTCSRCGAPLSPLALASWNR